MSTVDERVIRVTNRRFASNTYIYATGAGGRCIVIDPGIDVDAIEGELERQELVPEAIFATHGHFDHLAGAEPLRRKYSVPVHFHAADDRVARGSNLLMMALKLADRMMVPKDYVAIDEGLIWNHGDVRVELIHAPGHTPGSSILLVGGVAFTGDTIYRDDVFLVRLPEQDKGRLVRSIERAWDLLPDQTTVHPGHGAGGTFGQIKAFNLPLRRMLGIAEGQAS